MNSIRLAFRLVHIANIPHVLAQGFVHGTSPRANPHYVPIGDSSAIEARRQKKLDATTSIGDYIPFYFGPRSPMLYVIQRGYHNVSQCAAEDLVYCVIGIEDIITGGIHCQFTDGHALNEMTKFYPGGDLPKLNDTVRYEDVYATYWKTENDRDLKRRKEAELLVFDELPAQYIRGFIVFNENAEQKLLLLDGMDKKIIVKPSFYF